MIDSDWIEISYFDIDDFREYIECLPEDEYAKELENYSKQQAKYIIETDMKKASTFYEFMKKYSPRDYKIINNREYVSQRVITTHVYLWNNLKKHDIKKLRIFFL